MKKWRKGLAILFTASMIISALPANVQAASKSKVKLSKSKLTLYVGSAKTLKLKGTKKAPKWSSSKKSVASVTKKGKVKAKKQGSAVITAKLGKKKYKCKVTVKLKAASEKTPIVKPTEKPPVTPTEKPITPTEKPITPTKKPAVTPTEKPPVTPPISINGYQKLADYITTKGAYDPEEEYYFVTKEVENPSSILCTEIVYNVSENNFEFFLLLSSDGGGTTIFSLTITPPEYAKGDVVNIFMSSTNDVYSASGEVVLSELTLENPSITYTSTDAPVELRDSLYGLGENMLGLGLQYWGLMLEEDKEAPSLRDLGFISCQD